MAIYQPPSRRQIPPPSPAPTAWNGTRATGLPSRDLGSIGERLAHVDAAVRAGVLTRIEARLMRDLIRFARLPDPLAEIDIYQRYTTDPRLQRSAEWVVWTHAGERPVGWWMRVCHEVINPPEPPERPERRGRIH